MGAESHIESKVCKYAKELGFYVRKFSSPSHRGVPDRLFIAPNGVTAFIEFKSPGKKPTALQARELRLISQNKAACCFVDNYEDGKAFIDMIMEMEEYLLTVKSLNNSPLVEKLSAEDEMFVSSLSRARSLTLAQKQRVNQIFSDLHPT